ncbi:MAG TPA: hypothetical protein VGJ35_14530, partial [Burkholderiaceae bacterium]
MTIGSVGWDPVAVDRTVPVVPLNGVRCDLRFDRQKDIAMAIAELEARVRGRLPLDARAGTRVCAAEALDGHQIEVIYRIDRKGRRVINYFCDGARMSRATLLMLLCREAACPQAQGVRVQWRSFIGKPDRPASARVMPLRPAPLMVEVPVNGAGHR